MRDTTRIKYSRRFVDASRKESRVFQRIKPLTWILDIDPNLDRLLMNFALRSIFLEPKRPKRKVKITHNSNVIEHHALFFFFFF